MLNNLPLITIITPTFNRKELLEKALLSILNQKKDIPFELEYLIIDDWSNDWTKDFIQKYLDEYKNIKYFYQENSWVWKARNVGLDNMTKDSDYVIFLDSDNEIVENFIYKMLCRFNEAKECWNYNKIIWIWTYCKKDTWSIIWNNKILNWKNEITFTYNMYLQNKINWEIYVILKSAVYLENKDFRFPEDIINEGVLRSKMWKWIYKKWYEILFLDYIWEIYWTKNEFNNNKITKTISKDRFIKNAIWNERILEIIWDDLLRFWYYKSYADYLFKAWINWILYWEKQKWLFYLKKSLKNNFDLKFFIIFLLSILSKKIVLLIYKLYI